MNAEHLTEEQPMNAREKVGQQIREARRERRLSQQELAHLSGILQPRISKIENGRVAADVDEIEKIKAVLKSDIIL